MRNVTTMTHLLRFAPTRALVLALPFLVLLGAGGPARAADPAPAVPPPPPPPSQSAPPAQSTPAQSTSVAQAGAPAAPAEADGVKHVVFVPESVKAQLREEIKQEVLAQAKQEGWAAPNLVPGWVSRLRFSGDVRGRWERDLFAPGNANGGDFPDFNAINNNKPFDVTIHIADPSNDRYLNVDQNRTRPRLRARVGVDAEPLEGFSVGVRLGSGDSSSPVSNNQTLGTDFSKYQVWLDRAFVKFEPVRGPSSLAFLMGRFDNPFFGTDLLWWDDLAMDGLAMKAVANVGGGFRPFLTGGAFPLYITPLNYPAEQTAKFASHDKWLYAAQAGAEWAPAEGFAIKVGAAFYDFDHIEGRLSSPCNTNLSYVTCDTDDSRPAFAQKGNTYMELRTPSAAALAAEALAQAPEYQFFGLASRFREIVGTARVEYALSSAVRVGLEGEYVHNAGFSRMQIEGKALNNRGVLPPEPSTNGVPVSSPGPFIGGGNGVLGRVSLGTPALKERGDWRVRFGIRQVESDAVVDAFNDPDFGLGGTNLKGYSIDAALGLARGVSVAAHWFSADQVIGPKLGIDVLQFDLLAKF